MSLGPLTNLKVAVLQLKLGRRSEESSLNTCVKRRVLSGERREFQLVFNLKVYLT